MCEGCIHGSAFGCNVKEDVELNVSKGVCNDAAILRGKVIVYGSMKLVNGLWEFDSMASQIARGWDSSCASNKEPSSQCIHRLHSRNNCVRDRLKTLSE
jgi:hypothetical protein